MNDTTLVIQQSGDLITFDDSQVGLIKRTIAKDATDDELALFLHQAKRTGLDPLAKQIYFQKYNTRNGPQIAIITGIDGYRLVADRTGKYAGSDEPTFEGKQDYQGTSVPAKATVRVWKIVAGQRVPFAASVYWSEYCPAPPRDYQWKKMPHVMLAKCAEAAALRKAFPADLSGVYTSDEMQQAGSWVDISTGEIVDATLLESPRTAVLPQQAPQATPAPETPTAAENGPSQSLPSAASGQAGAGFKETDGDPRRETSPTAQAARAHLRPTASIYKAGDEVIVKGKDNEKPGSVLAVFDNGLVQVQIDGKALTVAPDKLTLDIIGNNGQVHRSSRLREGTG